MISWLVAPTNQGATRLTLFGGQDLSGSSRGHCASYIADHPRLRIAIKKKECK